MKIKDDTYFVIVFKMTLTFLVTRYIINIQVSFHTNVYFLFYLLSQIKFVKYTCSDCLVLLKIILNDVYYYHKHSLICIVFYILYLTGITRGYPGILITRDAGTRVLKFVTRQSSSNKQLIILQRLQHLSVFTVS